MCDGRCPITSGAAFILLQYVQGFRPFCVGVFVLMLLSDGSAPRCSWPSRLCPGRTARASRLVRLAVNLGFSLGPAIGELIIATWSYGGLFGWMASRASAPWR